MKILIGIISTSKGDKLYVLDDGQEMLINDDGKNQKDIYGNYSFLKKHSFKINDYPVTGPGVFRFRYGPVTSGIREAGVFQLYTYGEKILRATIDLSWKYREMAGTMQMTSPEAGLLMAERVCSNFAMSHSVAFSQSVETALEIKTSLLTKNWRILLLEAERIYNHLYVIYKLAAAAAQKVLAAHLSALFEEALRLNEQLTGSRYLMGINSIGRLNNNPSGPAVQKAVDGYKNLANTFTRLYEHGLANYNFLDRLHTSGTLTPDMAESMGLTGPSLRACGIKDGLNTTTSHLISLPVITQSGGDALARMEIRAGEIVNSCQYLIDHLRTSDSWIDNEETQIRKDKTGGTGYSVVNSPSGALGYYLNVKNGNVQDVNPFTPSYIGMHAVSHALEGAIFTDFPFIFDSFGIHFTDASC